MILDREKLIFIHIPRTGGTSIEVALAGKDWWLIEPETKHLSASMTRKLAGEGKWADYYKFSIVRNPWDRIISMYATGWWWKSNPIFDKGRTPSLREFIDKFCPHPHEKHQLIFYHEILDEPLDFLGRYENLNSDFQAICNHAGLQGKSLPHAEKRVREHYSVYFDERTALLVSQIYRTDIEFYGYEFDRKYNFDPDAIERLSG